MQPTPIFWKLNYLTMNNLITWRPYIHKKKKKQTHKKKTKKTKKQKQKQKTKLNKIK